MIRLPYHFSKSWKRCKSFSVFTILVSDTLDTLDFIHPREKAKNREVLADLPPIYVPKVMLHFFHFL